MVSYRDIGAVVWGNCQLQGEVEDQHYTTRQSVKNQEIWVIHQRALETNVCVGWGATLSPNESPRFISKDKKCAFIT